MPIEPLRMDGRAAPDDAVRARDSDWADRVRAGDVAAFEAMFRCFADPLCGYVYGYLRSTEETQELVQDLFLWIWRHHEQWEVAGQLRPYLYRAARNRAINHLRRRQIERRFQARALAEAPEDERTEGSLAADAEVRENDLSAAIDRAVQALSERCRQVFLLSRRQGLSYAQIAETLAISPKTVEIHMGRALSALRRDLADWIR